MTRVLKSKFFGGGPVTAAFVGTLAQRTLRMSSRNVRLIGVTLYRRSLGDVTS